MDYTTLYLKSSSTRVNPLALLEAPRIWPLPRREFGAVMLGDSKFGVDVERDIIGWAGAGGEESFQNILKCVSLNCITTKIMESNRKTESLEGRDQV